MTWLAVALCLFVSFIFSGIEAGILSVNRIRLRHRVKMRDRAAIKLNRLLTQPERLLVTVLIVTNLMNIFAITLTTGELVSRFGSMGYLFVFCGFLPVHLIGLELLPKSLFRRFPYRALAALAEPLRVADLLLSPMHGLGQFVMRMVSKNRPVEQSKLFVAREEFKYLTIESERTGTLTKAERQMIHDVVDFRAITASDVMQPMSEVKWIGVNDTVPDLLARSRELNIDRWPVLSETGEIVGLINVFDIALDGRKRGRIEPFYRRIVKVGPNEPAYSILRKLRAARGTMAAVVGEGAKPLGIVTWEELIKRLVGSVREDERDSRRGA